MRYCVFQMYPPVLFIVLFAATILLGYVEALHYANVCVEKWDMTPYRERFPRACEVQKLVKNNKLVQQFLVGRQFFVIFVVFTIAQITSFPYIPKNLWGMPSGFTQTFLRIGIPGVSWVLTVGQLVPQLYVEEFTLPFLNLHGCWFVTQLAFAAEFIGICHFSWILFYAVSSLLFGTVYETAAHTATGVPSCDPDATSSAGKANALTTTNLESRAAARVPTTSNVTASQERRVDFDEISLSSAAKGELTSWDIVRYIWSSCVTIGALAVCVTGIYYEYSLLPAPTVVVYLVFICALVLLFYLEGLMICIVATQYWDRETFKVSHPRAYMMHELVNRPENLKRFIVGRQFFTVLTNFLLAQTLVFPLWPRGNVPGVLFFIAIRSGMVGVMVILAFGQLCPELLAARYPLYFMNMMGSLSVVYLSLFIEWIGIGHAAWLFYFATRGLFCGQYLKVVDLKPEIVDPNKKKKEATSRV